MHIICLPQRVILKTKKMYLTNSKQSVSVTYTQSLVTYTIITYTIIVGMASRNYEYLVYLLEGQV